MAFLTFLAVRVARASLFSFSLSSFSVRARPLLRARFLTCVAGCAGGRGGRVGRGVPVGHGVRGVLVVCHDSMVAGGRSRRQSV
ncbi:hypothetical protein [Streptomyces phaeofaciens]|uniref:hypothetical protein n=1 Tax=Streptomyces phaeofaciens TaxID=68254 RepID=UPI003679F85C